MNNSPALLPDRWIQRIWDTMRATYGSAFDRMWSAPSGSDPVEHVKGLMFHWAKELGVYSSNSDAIAYALGNLPDLPPNLMQFKALCNRRPEPKRPALPAPDVNKEAAAKAIASAMSAAAGPADRFTPIRQLMYREISGDKRLTRFQKDFWRVALADELRGRFGIDTRERFDLADLAKMLGLTQQRIAA